MRPFRLALSAVASCALLFACASGGDPMPPRRDPNHVPEEVAKHPGFNAQKAQSINAPREKKPSSAGCMRTCSEGQRCEVVQGVERCVTVSVSE